MTRLDLKRHANAAYIAGHEAQIIVGQLAGPTGQQTPVACLTFSVPSTGGASCHGMLPASVLSASDYNSIAIQARIDAGVRIVNSEGGKSYELGGDLPGFASAAMVHDSDPSAIYASFSIDPDEEGVDWACVKNAFDTAANDQQEAKENYNSCVAAAYAIWFATLIICATAATLTAPACLVTMSVCIAAAYSALAVGMVQCQANYNSAIRRIQRQLLIDLRPCGIIIAEA